MANRRITYPVYRQPSHITFGTGSTRTLGDPEVATGAVFLISGHAFPGYWRSDKAWWRMKQFRFEETGRTAEPAIAPRREVITSGQSEGWMFDGVDNLVELLRYVQDGTLVPFESTFVAAQRGFFQSLEEGSGRLHPDTFDAMIDIQSARAASVTPLPLVEKP